MKSLIRCTYRYISCKVPVPCRSRFHDSVFVRTRQFPCRSLEIPSSSPSFHLLSSTTVSPQPLRLPCLLNPGKSGNIPETENEILSFGDPTKLISLLTDINIKLYGSTTQFITYILYRPSQSLDDTMLGSFLRLNLFGPSLSPSLYTDLTSVKTFDLSHPICSHSLLGSGVLKTGSFYLNNN